jgi:hypothetical protein
MGPAVQGLYGGQQLASGEAQKLLLQAGDRRATDGQRDSQPAHQSQQRSSEENLNQRPRQSLPLGQAGDRRDSGKAKDAASAHHNRCHIGQRRAAGARSKPARPTG